MTLERLAPDSDEDHGGLVPRPLPPNLNVDIGPDDRPLGGRFEIDIPPGKSGGPWEIGIDHRRVPLPVVIDDEGRRRGRRDRRPQPSIPDVPLPPFQPDFPHTPPGDVTYDMRHQVGNALEWS